MNLSELIDTMSRAHIALSKEVVIYGAGNFAQVCSDVLAKNGYTVLFFIDKYKFKERPVCNGIPVLSPADERLTPELKKNQNCILGIFNAYVDLAAIENDIKNSGFASVVNPLQFHSMFFQDIGEYFWLGDDREYGNNKEHLLQAFDLLADEHSKTLFENIMMYRQQKRLETIQSPQNVRVQYFPEDIPVKYPELSFVDCGAYDGDTLLKIVAKGMPLKVFTAFEPDIENITKLSRNLKKHITAEGYIFPCGVWNRSEQLRFSGGEGSASHIADEGGSVIQAVALDDVLINHDINFIKMDIEGAELQALEGAQNLIRQHEPILAISAYHRYDDLWTIPQLINRWGLSYRFYLRVYEYNGFELVYYAVPTKYFEHQ